MATIILYNDKVKYKDKLGLVKEVHGSFARVLFEGSKKLVTLPTDALEKVNDWCNYSFRDIKYATFTLGILLCRYTLFRV